MSFLDVYLAQRKEAASVAGLYAPVTMRGATSRLPVMTAKFYKYYTRFWTEQAGPDDLRPRFAACELDPVPQAIGIAAWETGFGVAQELDARLAVPPNVGGVRGALEAVGYYVEHPAEGLEQTTGQVSEAFGDTLIALVTGLAKNPVTLIVVGSVIYFKFVRK